MTGTLNLPGRANVISGNDPANWRTNLPTYAGMVTQQLYPGIDLHEQGIDGTLKGTYVVAPGADPSRIRWHYQGAETVQVDTAGNLVVSLPAPASTLTDTEALSSTLTELAPVAWQTINERDVAVPVRFAVGPSGIVRFALGAYDPRVPLIIDPTIVYSTYLGGSGEDGGNDIAVDASGNAYVSGIIGTSVVTKLNASGSAVLYSTSIAGASAPGLRIAVDSAANAYLVGTTRSPSFATTANAYQLSCNPGDTANCGEGDAFVTKLNSSGVPVYSSYLGGSDADQGIAVAVDPSGKVYVTGITASTTFPTKTPIQSCAANGNLFVTKIDPTLSGAASLIYSTCLGGNGADWGNDIAVDATGAAYIAGWSTSTDFPTTSGVIRPTHTTTEGEAVVVKLNTAGTTKTYATYLGGSGYESAEGIALDSSGNAYVTGTTGSTDFPLQNAYQPACGEAGCISGDAFVTKLNPTASALLYSTYLGGAGTEYGKGIGVDGQGYITVAGDTSASNFPTTPDAVRTSGTFFEVFVARLNPAASGTPSLLSSTLLGGSGDDNAWGVAVDRGGNTYVTGSTNSTNFQLVAPIQGTRGDTDYTDAFVTKLSTPGRTLRSSYDGLQRLISTDAFPGSAFAYGYDLAGNRTSVTLNGGTPAVTTYNAANQITNAGFSYDNAGNLLNDGAAAYTYDALNRTTVRGSTTYAYNGDGTLVSQATGGTTTRYTQDLATPLSQVLQTKVGSAAITDYLYGLNRLASLNGSTKTWYAADALGSVRRTVTDAGMPLGVINYDPWGTPETGTVPTFGFTGEVQDVSAGLVNLRARWYSTGRGRFTSVDPFVGFDTQPDTLHPYAYTGGNPINRTDPSGQCYGALEWLRNVEPENCTNLDKSVLIWHSDQASLFDKGWAYSYAFSFYVGHAAIVAAAIPTQVGIPIVSGAKAATVGAIAGVRWLWAAGSAWATTRLQSCQQTAQNTGQQLPALTQRGQLIVREGAELLDDEAVIVNRLLEEGKNITVLRTASAQGEQNVRTADLLINGIITELKTVSNLLGTNQDTLSKGLSSRIMDGVGQASNIIVNTSGQSGMTREIAERGVWRAFGSANGQNLLLESVRIIGEGFDFILRNGRIPPDLR